MTNVRLPRPPRRPERLATMIREGDVFTVRDGDTYTAAGPAYVRGDGTVRIPTTYCALGPFQQTGRILILHPHAIVTLED